VSTVSTREWLRQSTGQADQEQVDEDLKGAAEEPDPGHRPAPAGRRDRQERIRRGGSQAVSAGPGAGDVPRYPDPLPGKLPHILHAAQALPAQSPPLDVGPARPAYGGMMAHGVPAPVQHGGRPAPRPEHAAALMANRVPESYQPPPRPSPVPVYLVPEGAGARPLKRIATKQVLVPGPSTAGAPAIPAQICGKDPRRTTVRLMNESPAVGSASTVAAGSVAAPVTAGEQIVSTGPLPAGTYTVTASTILNGTPTFADVNNVALKLNGTQVAVLPVQAASELDTSITLTVPVPAGGILTANTIGLGSGTAVYNVVLSATPQAAGGMAMRVLTDQVSTVPAALGGSVEGSLLPPGMSSYQDFQTQDELFVVVDPNSTGTAAAYLSVIIEYSVPNGA
jgi:hypothetical protein